MIKYELLFVNRNGEEKYLCIITDEKENKEAESKYLNRKIDKYILRNPDYQYQSVRKITCRACIDEIMNQLGHMEYGGCLYDPELE